MGIQSLIEGDCLDVMPTLYADSVDSCVTDPPYGLKFMGKKWDYDVPSVEQWKEVYRVLKPGAFLLSFGGCRTYHRMVVNIEDAGFEIRDQIQWLYGSGFPKSLDVGKAIDKLKGAIREVVGKRNPFIDGGLRRTAEKESGVDFVSEKHLKNGMVDITVPATPEAKQWEGWGTALKPANEPICLARKPFKGTVAENVLKWGTGGLNIDGCRVDASEGKTKGGCVKKTSIWGSGNEGRNIDTHPQGRFPANVIHDGSEEVVGLFPVTTSGARKGKTSANADRIFKLYGGPCESSEGSAARFFYCAKASKAEREGSTHPTIKPLALMRYLCRLITSPGGIVIDPFMGSGTTGKAAIMEGFEFIGIEREHEHVETARNRIENTDPIFQRVG